MASARRSRRRPVPRRCSISRGCLRFPLNASRWCATRSEDREDYSEDEAEYLATIEEEVPAALEELVDLVLEFIEEELG